jgi:organic radical activating enzyme
MPVPDSLVVRQLDLELAGGCNYKCQMCPQAEGRETDFLKMLPYDLFCSIVEDAMQYGLESVSLHGSGEPTLHPQMAEMVKFVKDKGLQCVSFTNGSRLDKTLSHHLIEAGLDVLRISAIGYDQVSYHQWMSRDLFETVRKNVREFVVLNRDLGGHTEVHLNHLVTDINNVDAELRAYQENWVDFTGALAEVWLMHNWSGQFEGPYDRENLVRRSERRSCGRPFSPLLEVRAGGIEGQQAAVVACCMVLGHDSQAVLGHLDTQSIAEIVSGPKFTRLRDVHTEQRFDDIPYCANCDQLYDVPEALVWTNIPGRKYGQSKIASGVDHRQYASVEG